MTERLREVAASVQLVGSAQLVVAGCLPATGPPPDRRMRDWVRTPAAWQPTAARTRGALDLGVEPPDSCSPGVSDELLAAVGTLASPTDLLLLLGGDHRTIPQHGLNAYGFPVVDPDPIALLSSCTCSPPGRSERATVERWRASLLEEVLVAQRAPAPERLREPVAVGVAAFLGLPAGDAERLVLAPSGTDAELVVAAIALYSQGRPLVNIVVGGSEAGSGTLRAAGGLWSSTSAPLSGGMSAGGAVAGLGSDLIRVVDIEVRDSRGRERRSFDVYAEVEAHVEAGLHDGATVLVHVLESSKTGLSFIDPAWVQTWRRRYPRTLRVVVDAAQARTESDRLRSFLRAGASIIVTGSKSLSGAPFSAALVLDDALLDDVSACDSLPSGFDALLSQADVPLDMRRLATGWQPANLGLLARWHTALAQHRQLQQVSEEQQKAWTARLLDQLTAGLNRLAAVSVLPPPRPDASVLCFTIKGRNGVLGRGPLGKLHRTLAAKGLYLGQPAELVVGGAAVLRAAVGAATLNGAVAAADADTHLDEVLHATIDGVDHALRFETGIDVRT